MIEFRLVTASRGNVPQMCGTCSTATTCRDHPAEGHEVHVIEDYGSTCHCGSVAVGRTGG